MQMTTLPHPHKCSYVVAIFIYNHFESPITYKGVFLNFGVEGGVEESIVNEPLILKTLLDRIV
jgi:hypothetical protein